MKLSELKRAIRRAVVQLSEDRRAVQSVVDRAFDKEGVFHPSMQSMGGSRYEGEIDTGWTLRYDEKSGTVDINGLTFDSLESAAKHYKQNRKKGPPTALDPAASSLIVRPGRVVGLKYDGGNEPQFHVFRDVQQFADVIGISLDEAQGYIDDSGGYIEDSNWWFFDEPNQLYVEDHTFDDP